MNTSFTSLPLPDACELDRMPSEFAGLLQAVCSINRAKSYTRFPRLGEYAQRRQEPVQVLHIDDPRASIYALFA